MISRTTSSQINDSLINYMSSTQTKLNDLTKQMASQKKVNSITDDAVAAKAILNTKKEINLYNGYIGNMKTSQFELKAVDDALTSSKTQSQRSLDIALMASNGTYGESEMQGFQKEVDGIISTVTSLANTKYNDTYIFSGTASLKQPYSAKETSTGYSFEKVSDTEITRTANDGTTLSIKKNAADPTDTKWYENGDTTKEYTDWNINSTEIKYNGTDEKRKILIGDDGLEENVSIVGKDIFGGGTVSTVFNPDEGKQEVKTTGEGGLLASLYQLSAAMKVGDTEKISSSIDGLQKGLDTLAESRATTGIASNRFDNLISAYDNNVSNLTDLKSSLEDADLSALISEWTAQQYALEASYAISSQMMQTNIMNYI